MHVFKRLPEKPQILLSLRSGASRVSKAARWRNLRSPPSVVPSGLSSKMMPSAASWVRIRSASAKFCAPCVRPFPDQILDFDSPIDSFADAALGSKVCGNLLPLLGILLQDPEHRTGRKQIASPVGSVVGPAGLQCT